MESPEDIEKALGRLMPSAISEKGQRSMEESIDRLASGQPVVLKAPARKVISWPWVGGIGAAAAAVVVAWSVPRGGPPVVERKAPVEGGLVSIGTPEPVAPVAVNADPGTRAASPLITAPRLGLKVGRLDDVVRAHVPDLPPGIGFVVSTVEPGSPAEKAGLKPYDVFWKLDDQLIASESQLFKLLCLHKTGDEVALGIYRSGRSLGLPVVLGPTPADAVAGPLPSDERVGAVAAPLDVPMLVLRPAERTAEIDAADGKAVLSLGEGLAVVEIHSSDGVVLYKGPLLDPNGGSLVPDPWKPRVAALERALVHAVKDSPTPTRPREGADEHK